MTYLLWNDLIKLKNGQLVVTALNYPQNARLPRLERVTLNGLKTGHFDLIRRTINALESELHSTQKYKRNVRCFIIPVFFVCC